ncbi:MAG: exodeoxyribonuclease VII large subunit [Acidaminococcaceae bacterium]|jgi:exodeoxyribonuclease VII large subunit|nr:exodeoxyribonuclease VII large subunit [Acidaminococcaceae bacterium]
MRSPLQGKTLSVGQVNDLVKELVEGSDLFHHLQVQGEVSNFKRYPSGHCYFTLKDASGVLKCVMFRYRAVSLKALPLNGDTVLCVGRLGVYERDGVYQLYVDALLPRGLGNLMQQYEALKAKLSKEGLFDEAKKRPLPVNPRTVGIITSPAGAAVHDIITVSHRRNRGVKLLLFPVKVQGEGAAAEIVRALKFMNEHRLAEVLIVGRGGGSIEDLWAFNEEAVVRAVAASKIPVIASIGHETDFTLTDFAADKRAATPSQAAELAVADTDAYLYRVEALQGRSRKALLRIYRDKEAAYRRLAASRILQDPHTLLEVPAERLDRALEKLQRLTQDKLQESGQALGLLAARLDAVSPLAVLQRGYAVVSGEDGTRLVSVNKVRWGEELTTRLADGRIISVVQEIKELDDEKNS